ncbi:hypothetical protein P691DRAFT_794495 [Macrolepiota fuliginosa MF-IS2]|uniref:Pentatricopeptide repeat-containing protein-mitochondrial domain-containing protein n=1 Tax=Macrolepiota fuliginosa MF-IS2 TaxID=1400762 RepID=A0A9P6C2C8_9AGAR|nr:hypothetical protein P691DRAFT_794495 [Macrolepiota fuliginosa MF-IS2]
MKRVIQLINQRPRRRLVPCLASAAEMKQKGVMPNLVIYNSMLEAAAEDGFWLDAWAILDDMLLMGVKPNAMSFNHLLHAVRFKHNHHVARVINKMEACSVKPNAQTLGLIITRYAAEGNLEMAIRHLLTVPKYNVVPDLQTVQSVIILAARNNFSRLALDLANWFERISTRRLEESVWVNCLIAAAETSHIEGVHQCWNTVTKHFKTLLDEGICLSVLNTAARHGSPELATEALQMLQTINVPPQEHHFAAIIEAFCQSGQVKEAILVLDLMTSSDIVPSIETTKPISESIKQDLEKIDATWQLVKEFHKEGRRLDISAPRAVIAAAVACGDLTRALTFYKALSQFNLSPELQIYNLLLQACVRATDRRMGDHLLADMKTAKVAPSRDTYENIIHLCLTQPVYEDAFFYLEEMKAAGFKPPLSVYTALVDKCLSANDTRHQIALQEMEECEYVIPPALQSRIAGTGTRGEVVEASTQPSLSEGERRFIEQGGLV